MAFHVSCPITSRRICNCKLGFPPEVRTCESRDEFVKAAASVQALFNDPALIYGKKDENVQVLVPKVGVGGGGGDVAVVAVADCAKRFESGFTKDVGDEQGLSNAKVMCRLCFSAENEGSGRARKMLSCKSCSKKYHSSCIKSWAQNRDLFHWSTWTCPSCRSCEVCQENGDPNKLMFCKRCDDAYHCYCQQPAHKNVSSGPYLCPKHTKCHSCASTVPGNGLSVRWFLGYTCCDACGRLFVKGNYCPVCLKVYRDSESTPMVCCDVCQRWVHCHCDGISDEKYMQFQVDNNLQYRCATCRGECYKVRDLEDAVQELWRRRDKADHELTASLRAAAGLPTQEEIFSVQPYSDDDDDGSPLAKNEHGRSLKFSLKGIVDKAPKKKSSSKKSVKKKGYSALSFGRTEPLTKSHTDAQSAGFITDDKFKEVDVQSSRSTEYEIAGSLNDAVWSSNQARYHKNSLVKTDRLSRDKMNNRRSHGFDTMEQTGKSADKSINTKGPKLVIHLGARNKNVTSSPRSDAANLHPGQDLITSNDSEDMFRHRANGKHLNRSKISDIKGDTLGHDDQNRLRLRGKEGSTIKIRKLNPEIPDAKPRVSSGKRSETPSLRGQEAPDGLNGSNKTKELKPLLRLKFKNPYADRQTSLAQSGEDDKSSIKGQRSKRKRPSPLMGDPLFVEEYEGADCSSDEDMGEIMDANWIIQKLGKDAIGKKVEVHQRSNRTWHKGTVHEVFEGTSVVSVTLDDGKTSNVDLGKQGIRFYSQKRRW